jgi:hypothetical protein
MGIVGIIATVLPIIPLFFIRILIPDKGQKESLLLENEGEEEEDQIYSSDDSVTTTTTTEKEEKEEEKKKNKSKIQDICNYEMIELNTVK